VGATRLAALCDKLLGHLPHGASYLGWIATLVLLSSVVLGGSSYVRSRTQLKRLYVAPHVGAHLVWLGIDVAVLPVSESIAYSRLRPRPQVVVSRGLLESLDGSELELLLRHESVHIQRRDERILVSLTAIEAAFRWLPLVRYSVAATRLALERSADEAASGDELSRRQKLVSALLKAALPAVPGPLPAFSAASSVVERIEAMEGRIIPLPASQGMALMASSAVLRFLGTAGAATAFILLTLVCAK